MEISKINLPGLKIQKKVEEYEVMSKSENMQRFEVIGNLGQKTFSVGKRMSRN